MSSTLFSCIVLAAGDRQHPEDPGAGRVSKNLADLDGGTSVIHRVVSNAIAAGIPEHRITVVVKRSLAKRFQDIFPNTGIQLAYQDVARGSADAVRLVMEQGRIAPCKHILLLMGDQPNIRPTTLKQLMRVHEKAQRLVTVTTFTGNRAHPAFRKCGVIGNDAEQRFAILRPDRQEANMLMHAGPYVFLRSWLHECITHIDWKRGGETHVYLAVSAAACLGNGIQTFHIPDTWEVLGADTYEALEAIRRNDRAYLNLP